MPSVCIILGLPSTPESEKKLDLADVEIEADDGALDEFLATSSSDVALAGLTSVFYKFEYIQTTQSISKQIF